MTKKVAIACQGGGGMHAAFEVDVLTEILNNIDEQKKRRDIDDKKRFELVGISGTSAGALCALMVWYGLAPKTNRPGSEHEASDLRNDVWDNFVAAPGVESVLNFLTYSTFRAEEAEIAGQGRLLSQRRSLSRNTNIRSSIPSGILTHSPPDLSGKLLQNEGRSNAAR
jgi:predicted acylesterase/phospholipase RssA